MASTACACVTMTITFDAGFSVADVDHAAQVVDEHVELTLLGSDPVAGTVTAEFNYTVTVDATTGTFDAQPDPA